MEIPKETWVSEKAGVRNSSVQGKGTFAVQPIAAGERVVVWGGEFVDRATAERARAEGKLVMQYDDDLYSIEDRGEDDGYFINHSCDPNLWLDGPVMLIARRDIQVGEELTADYALWEADEEKISRWECRCGSANCRGRVTGRDWRKPELQMRYAGHFTPLINKRIAAQV